MIQDLLKPRIKVIAPWPGMEDDGYEVGQIYSGDEKDLNIKMLTSYPHLFKKLEWWEERKPEEMPEYVKDQRDGHIGKIQIQSQHTPSDVFLIGPKAVWFGWISLYDCVPATHEEYLNNQTS